LVASLTNFEPRQFSEPIVTADETWVHRYEPESKAQSMVWKSPTSPVAKKFKSQPSAGKIMLTLFWDMEGTILIHTAIQSRSHPQRFPYVWPTKKKL
jgi:histone-lysine N-methyltransferase SETMAR